MLGPHASSGCFRCITAAQGSAATVRFGSKSAIGENSILGGEIDHNHGDFHQNTHEKRSVSG